MSKIRRYSMNKRQADKMLQNVFMECNQTPNTTPFDKLVIKGFAQTKAITVCKYTALALLIFILLTPLFFRNPEFVVKRTFFTETVISNHQLNEDSFLLVIEGTSIDEDGIHAIKDTGEPVFPTRIQHNENMTISVEFPFDGDSMNIYIPSYDKKTLQAYLSIR